GPGHSAVVYYVSGGRKINWICMGSSPSSRAESWSATASTEEVLGVYRGWNPEVTELVRISPTPFVTALYDRAPLDRWVKGRIVLMG
ncbi:hydroxylase, partial [Citrobacter sp. AAK_AS5]